MESSNQFLGTERIGKLMQKYAIPCIISLLVGALYNIVDQIFIANASYLGSYVPYKIGKLQIQGFSEPTTPNKIKQSYHITQKAARSRPRAAFLRGKLGRRQDFSKNKYKIFK